MSAIHALKYYIKKGHRHRKINNPTLSDNIRIYTLPHAILP